MLQQTQVSRVLEKFGPFLTKFPTVIALAEANEADVMAAWSGLGYYRRARLLQACAQAVVREHAGTVPCDVQKLKALPGVGRYTAGAIASIMFGEKAPIVDGNVCRVLQRLDAHAGHAGDRKVTDWAWSRAEQLVALTSRGNQVARFNEGLMELGATVCTPDSPRCGECPLRKECSANREGLTESIPAPKPRAKRSRVHHDVVIVHRRGANGATEYLLEQRSESGLWAGMWQPPACEHPHEPASDSIDRLLDAVGLKSLAPEPSISLAKSVFHTTHREVWFRVWKVLAPVRFAGGSRKWFSETSMNDIAISNAHRQLLLGVE